MTKEEIGAILRNLRLNVGMTQSQVARAIGRTQQIIGHWETGYSQPDADTLFTLCSLYGASIDEAFGFLDNKKPPSAEAEGSKYQDIIEMLDRLPFEQVCEIKGYIKRIVHESEAADAAKQITDVG